MGDAPGQRAQGLHLVGLAKPRFQHLALSDVDGKFEFDLPSVGPSNDPVGGGEIPIGGLAVVLPVKHLVFVLQDLFIVAEGTGAVEIVKHPVAGLADDILPVQFPGELIGEQHLESVGLHDIDDRGDGFKNRKKPLPIFR